jgi:hypothetical protein
MALGFIDIAGAGVSPPTVSPFTKLRDVLAREIKSGELVRALVVIGPLVAAYVVLREPALLNLGLIAISLLIPVLKLRLSTRAIALHFLAILATFGALFLAAPIKPLFVALTALAAFLAVAVTRYGDALRTIGNWVFIPAVYLACEVREGATAQEALRHAGFIVAASPIALAMVCGIRMFDQRRSGDAPSNYGTAATEWFLPAAATAIAVFAAAAFAGGASGIAEERVANVIIGGVFGIIAVALTELIWRRVARKGAGESQVSS